jgi:hypothetical protein
MKSIRIFLAITYQFMVVEKKKEKELAFPESHKMN